MHADVEGFTCFKDWWDWNLISDDSDDEVEARQRRRVAKRKPKAAVRREGPKSRAQTHVPENSPMAPTTPQANWGVSPIHPPQ
jgi:hypothetical protein